MMSDIARDFGFMGMSYLEMSSGNLSKLHHAPFGGWVRRQHISLSRGRIALTHGMSNASFTAEHLD